MSQHAYIWEPVTGTCESQMDTCLHAMQWLPPPSTLIDRALIVEARPFHAHDDAAFSISSTRLTPVVVLGPIPMDHSHTCNILSTRGD